MIDARAHSRGLRAQWHSRPLTLRIYVAVHVAWVPLSIALDPRQLELPWILLTFLSLVLLKMLWDGSSGAWWFFVIVDGATVALVLAAAFQGASVWLQFAISAAALMLLVHGSTRAWFNRPIAERFP